MPWPAFSRARGRCTSASGLPSRRQSRPPDSGYRFPRRRRANRYLARRFVAQGWSIKQLVRELVGSRTWRLSSADDPKNHDRDPDNRLYGRMNRVRLDAEQLRDLMLTASGHLDRRLWGPNIAGAGMIDADDTAAQSVEYGYQFADTRRSLYAPAFRNRRLELFESFDFANINAPVSQRPASTVAPQALYLLNHPFVMEHARLTADRQVAKFGQNDEQLVTEAVRSVLGRSPTAVELDLLRAQLHSRTNCTFWDWTTSS